MESLYEKEFARVVGVEGRYCNVPGDSGGETCYGITAAVARSNGWFGPMRELPLDFAKEVYRRRYWGRLGCDFIGVVSPELAHELFDAGVNCGVDNAGAWLQRGLNALNNGGELYPDIPVDASVGPVTLRSFDKLWSVRGHDGAIALARLCDSQQGAYYLDLVLRRAKDEKFLYGWARNRLGVAA